MSTPFDLNHNEKSLSDWNVVCALKELVSNALDEHVLQGIGELPLFERDEDGTVTISDSGRGIEAAHLSVNENEEKANTEGVIGRFGGGMKEAAAVLFREKKQFEIKSRQLAINGAQLLPKHGYGNIETIHLMVEEEDDPDFVGTVIKVSDISEQDYLETRSLFVQLSESVRLFRCPFGELYKAPNGKACIYIAGVKMANDPKSYFSYNITSLTKQVKSGIQRDRKNISKTHYGSRTEDILRKLLASKHHSSTKELVALYRSGGHGNYSDLRKKKIEGDLYTLSNEQLTGDRIVNEASLDKEEKERLKQTKDQLKLWGVNRAVLIFEDDKRDAYLDGDRPYLNRLFLSRDNKEVARVLLRLYP